MPLLDEHCGADAMKVVSVVGTRPQLIKVAPFSRELRKVHQEILVDTGQHYDEDMAGNFYSELGIPKPDYLLGVGSASHGEQTARMLTGIEKILIAERPSIVVVFGDTNSTLAGALAASKIGIPVAHIEAGLRSYDRSMPEEINRVITDHVSAMLFCPTAISKDNLKKEGITEGVHFVGDIMVDTLEESRCAARKHAKILDRLGLARREYQFMTVHRPSNTDQKANMKSILKGVGASGVETVFAVHPRTARRLREFRLENLPKNIRLIEPVGHTDAVSLVENSLRVLTDSGGLQKEAYLLGVPCITLRDRTEWIETVRAGWNTLVGADADKIRKAVATFTPPKERPRLFGRQGVAKRMVMLMESCRGDTA